MYHVRYNGVHYDMGYKWGQRLRKHNQVILDNVPFEINKDRIDFAKACLPCYEKFFPEILKEIQGLADGQEMPFERFIGVLFSMYAMPPETNCSVFAISDEDNILLARNSDFLTALEHLNMNVLYTFKDCSSFSFTGNTTAFIEIEDGMNEHGLAIGFTSVYPHNHKPGLNSGMIVRLILEKCSNVAETLEMMSRIPIASSQTITVADSLGNIALIESNCDSVSVVKDRQAVFAVNCFHNEDMEIYNDCNIDTWNSEERYQTMKKAILGHSVDVSYAQDVLSGKYGFICQYDRETGKDTVWSVVYDLKNQTVFRAEGNPARKKYIQDVRVNF